MTELEYVIKHGGMTRSQLLKRITRRGFGATVLGGLAGAAASRLIAAPSSAASAAPDFTIAIIPDPQYLAASCPDTSGGYYAAMMQWIVANRNVVFASGKHPFSANIKAVVGVGDCVNSVSGANEYMNAQAAWSILDANNIAFTTPPGNHDYGGGPSSRSNLGDQFATGYFSAGNRSSVYGSGIGLGGGDMAYWVGSFDTTGANTAVKFIISRVKMLILAMDFFAGSAAWSWAYDVVLANPDCECYITTHAWLTAKGEQFQRTDAYGPNAYSMAAAPYSNSAAEAWETIGVNTWPNLRGIFSGHDICGSPSSDPPVIDSPWYWKKAPARSLSPGGQTVHQLFANSQQIDDTCSASVSQTSGAGQVASVFLFSRRPALGLIEGRMISTHSGDWFGSGSAVSGGTSWSASETLLFSVPFRPRESAAEKTPAP
jgi:hypothetical protein